MPLPVTSFETSHSLKPLDTPVTLSSASPVAARPGLASRALSGEACAVTVAANCCQACTRSVARTLTAAAGTVVTANSMTASRPPRGLPSQRVGQVASVVLAALSPSCVTAVAVVSATARIDRSSLASSGIMVATMPATTDPPTTPMAMALRRGPERNRVMRCSPCLVKETPCVCVRNGEQRIDDQDLSPGRQFPVSAS